MTSESNMRENLKMTLPDTDSANVWDLSDKRRMRTNWKLRIRYVLKTASLPSISPVRRIQSHGPTADEVTEWAQSFDNLLCHTYGKAAFHIFLKSEFCEENIEFWNVCEDFKTITSKRKLVTKAKSISEEFIQSDAPKEINIDFQTKEAIIRSLHEPTVASFHAAQNKVYSLMENNSYRRFINSELYKEIFAMARQKENA